MGHPVYKLANTYCLYTHNTLSSTAWNLERTNENDGFKTIYFIRRTFRDLRKRLAEANTFETLEGISVQHYHILIW